MKLSDFTVGQEVFIYDNSYPGGHIDIYRAVVAKVGKKYVSVARYPEQNTELNRFRATDEAYNFLSEKRDCGTRRKLFASKQAIDDYSKKRKLVDWLEMIFFARGGEQYTLEQLKRVEEILRGDNND
jgi:hypothetical protein